MVFREVVSHLLALVLGVAALNVHAADARIPLSSGGSLVLPVPDGWRQSDFPGPVKTLSLTPAAGNAFQILVSPLARTDAPSASIDSAAIRRLVESGANSARSQAVEKSVTVQDIKSATVQGNYFSATDRAPEPDGFKYMTQGAMLVNGLPVTFTILSNSNTSATVELALRMLRGSRRE
jgi:hypothetical protein